MNPMKEHLDRSLSGLTVSPVLEIKILHRAAAVPRRRRFRTVAVTAAILAAMGISAAAAVLAIGWSAHYHPVENTVEITYSEPMSSVLSDEALADFSRIIPTGRDRLHFSGMAEMETATGVSLLFSQKITNEQSVHLSFWAQKPSGYLASARCSAEYALPSLWVRIAGLRTSAAVSLSASYLVGGEEEIHMSFLRQVYSEGELLEYYVPQLGITAAISLSGDGQDAIAFFQSEDVIYELKVSVPYFYVNRKLSDAETVLLDILNTLE